MSAEKITQLHRAAQQYLNQAASNKNALKQSHQACVEMLKLDPKHADAHFLLSMIALNMQQMTKAIELNKVAIQFAPQNAEYWAFYARSLSLVNRYEEARTAIEKGMKLGSNSPLVNDTMGVVLSRLGEHARAVELFNKAIGKQASNPSFCYNLASSLKFLGDFKQAQQAYEKVIALNPKYYQAHSALAELNLSTKTNNKISRLLTLLESVGKHVDGELHLCHALAKEYECVGEYEKALQALERGNSKKKAQLAYTSKDDDALFSVLKTTFSQEFIDKKHLGFKTTQPIFVLGMPRSGTTLVDRILSSHSDVVSAGELQNFAVELKKLTQTPGNKVLDPNTITAAKSIDFRALGERYLQSTKPVSDQAIHFIDKMPLNFLQIGFIKKALPNAKIIILNRHPMDVCLSNFRTLFAINFSYYNYAYNLLDCARYFHQFKMLMDFWQSSYPNELLEVKYEALVANPEEQIKRILAYCELPWQAECLAFHNNPAPVSTASSVQVRQPINSSSIGRWQRYGNALEEMQNYLQKHDLCE
ncbi:tetratricopeptide repeat-containing sulfotransferase family protein [Glaciecola sp. 2405UD65-10]|uniref:tetratricopeptide repeat-containing sulfotransferase family protein n=1 Tax=Glaciecola sp. 2405UD65-10 TaxID=3397244 RepID=UPI003B5C2EC1